MAPRRGPSGGTGDGFTDAQAAEFDLVFAHLSSVSRDMTDLSKRRPSDRVSSLKATVIQRLLDRAQHVLTGEQSLTLLDQLPADPPCSQSDASLILGQWVTAMERFRSRHSGRGSQGGTVWYTKEHPEPEHKMSVLEQLRQGLDE